MRRAIRTTSAFALLVVAAVVAIKAQEARQGHGGTRVLGTHQIDRYEAIQQVRAALKADPNNLKDWIILGELAQEVAGEVPANLAPGYYKLAHDAYEDALKLAPNDAHLKAASRFALEQEQHAEQSAKARQRAVQPYLEARRRELSQPGATPTVRVYSMPGTPTSTAISTPMQPYYYQPYIASQGEPYTYRHHSRIHLSPEDEGVPAQPQPGQILTATERAALVKPAAKFAPP